MNHINWTENVVDIIERRIDGCDDEDLVDEIGLVSTYINILCDEAGYPGAELEKLVRQDASGGRLGRIRYKDMRDELMECEVTGINWHDNECVCRVYREMLVSTIAHLYELELMENSL